MFEHFFLPKKLGGLANTTDRERATCSVKRGDVFLTRTSETQDELGMSSVALVDYPEATFNGFTKRLRPLGSVDVEPEFVGFYFRSPKFRATVTSISSITTRASLNNEMLGTLRIAVPPPAEQKAIASVLLSLNDKIDLLRRQNQTLEAMAGALFRLWFSASLDDESGCRIDALIDFNPTRKLAKGVAAPYVEMAALSEHSFNPEGWYERAFSSGMKFVNGDTLLARITPCLENGKTAYITFLKDGEVAWGSTEYIVMRPKDGLHPLFAYAMARHGEFRDHAEGCLAGSSGRQRVELEHLMGYRVRAPSSEGIAAFNRTAAAIDPKLRANAEQINTLKALRDNLLPKLMTGEVRVAC